MPQALEITLQGTLGGGVSGVTRATARCCHAAEADESACDADFSLGR